MYNIIDFITKEVVQPNGLIFSGENDQPWEIVMDMDKVSQNLNMHYFKISPPGLAKYLPIMPIKQTSKFISLQESATPLLKSKYLGKRLGVDLYFKLEGKNTTGSFKDRGSAVEISIAKEMGAPAIILASTGNMAASCACYAAAASIPCFILVPEGIPIGKIAQVIAFGGKIVQVKGSYNDAANLAKKVAKEKGFYLAGDYAFRVEGQKTAAFEIADQMLLQAPDVVIVPIGCGTNISAYAKGFDEYFKLGLLDKKPKLFGVQANGSAAVVNSYLENRSDIIPLAQVNTIASAISVPNPIDGIKALHAIRSTEGKAVSVTDQEILEAQHLLSTNEGIFVESSSAATVAALLKDEVFQNEATGKRIVCVLTGDGLKDAGVILKAAIKPPTIYPKMQEFVELLESRFFNNKSIIFVDKNDIIFTEVSTIDEIKAKAIDLLNAEYDEDTLSRIREILKKILQKGKHITIADFQDSIEYAIEQSRYKTEKAFSVLDFHVKSYKDKESHAEVRVKIHETESSAISTGTGPVDAAINALCNACKDAVAFQLLEYKVEIRGQGTDAVVYVELKLCKGHNYSIGYAASSDIIQASIEAFEVAYNSFEFK